MVGALFSLFAHLTEGGVRGIKQFWQCLYGNNTFQKGVPGNFFYWLKWSYRQLSQVSNCKRIMLAQISIDLMSQVFWRVLLDPEQDLWRVGDQGRKLKNADADDTEDNVVKV